MNQDIRAPYYGELGRLSFSPGWARPAPAMWPSPRPHLKPAVWRYAAADHRLRLELTQVQAAAWGVFRLPRLVVEVLSLDGKVTRRVFSMDGRSSVAYLETATPPSEVRVDPDGRLLLTATIEKGAP